MSLEKEIVLDAIFVFSHCVVYIVPDQCQCEELQNRIETDRRVSRIVSNAEMSSKQDSQAGEETVDQSGFRD